MSTPVKSPRPVGPWHIRACYAWAKKRGRVPTNPLKNLPVSAGTTERDRVLTDNELRQIWAASGVLPYPFGPFYRLTILTLQRREEVAGMRWSEVSQDLRLWTIPGQRMKNGRSHDVHLSEAAAEVLRSIPRILNSDLIFTTTGKTPVSGYSRAKAQLDAKVLGLDESRSRMGPPAGWRLHDLRRTGVTRLAALGFDSIVVDKILAHQPAKLKGVASVYQRHDFARERAKALDAWSAHVTSTASVDNVVEFSRR